ncbi:hypothetical protein CEP54_014052 [Fusarium duplospermum]|uniref:GST N-terminal domain-containing protein n=1 Tax=Fusarium duplospermum TaxID=1325734 RepID=A0A428NYT7_9HYPO|nr:hypothetical protein CEP54_014052 [Fusarium duplospermum]
MDSEPFKSLNPNSKVPAIEDPNTGIRLFEAGAIVLYLLDTYDTSGTLRSSLSNESLTVMFPTPDLVNLDKGTAKTPFTDVE